MTRFFSAAITVSLMAVCMPVMAAKPARTANAGKTIPEVKAMTAFVAAWDRASPEALSQLFEEEGKLVIPGGTEIGGRETIKSFYAVTFQSGYKGSKAGARVLRVTRLGNSLALVEGAWSIRGAKRPNGAARPPETGRFSALVREAGNDYRLVALSEMSLAQ